MAQDVQEARLEAAESLSSETNKHNSTNKKEQRSNMKTNRWLGVTTLAAVLALSAMTSMGQDRGRDNRDRPDRGRFDPAQMRERMMGYYREQLEVKDDAEWNVIQPLIQKVMDARMATMTGRGFGGFGRGGGPGGGPGDRGGDDRGRGPFGGQPNPEVEALQKAVDGKASNAELKAALSRYQESRKAKEEDLQKAQAELRKVLSVRQEAIATLRGLL